MCLVEVPASDRKFGPAHGQPALDMLQHGSESANAADQLWRQPDVIGEELVEAGVTEARFRLHVRNSAHAGLFQKFLNGVLYRGMERKPSRDFADKVAFEHPELDMQSAGRK